MSPAPAPAPLWQRLLRSVLIIGLALVMTILLLLALIGYLPAVHAAFEPLFSSFGKSQPVAVGVTILLIILTPLVLLSLASRRRRLTWPVLAAAWLAALPVLGWLAWDEPAVQQAVSIEEFSPAFPGAEESYAVLMQYSKQTPSADATAFASFKPALQWSGNTRDPAKWIDYVQKNRVAIEKDWEALAPQRRWFAELAAFPRLGDLTPPDFAANIPAFAVWRTLSQRTCAIATLQALDGRGDEALALLAPQLAVARKLQLSSRTLIRTMIAVVVERMTLETTAIVLDRAPASAARRAQLVAALGSENGAALARRLLMTEYVIFTPATLHMKLGDLMVATRGVDNFPLRRSLNFISALFLNPIATANIYGRQVRELADLAEARELGKFAVRSQALGNLVEHQPSMKNVGGRLMLTMAVPSFTKVEESHWATTDLRVGLRTRLAAAN